MVKAKKYKCPECLKTEVDCGQFTKIKGNQGFRYIHTEICLPDYNRLLNKKIEINDRRKEFVQKIVDIHELDSSAYVPTSFWQYVETVKNKNNNQEKFFEDLTNAYTYCEKKIKTAKMNKPFDNTLSELKYGLSIAMNSLNDAKNNLKSQNSYTRELTEEQLHILESYKFESEIEKIMVSELLFSNKKNDLTYNISTQKRFTINNKKYRVDILLGVIINNNTYEYAIEVDGYEFHEKTKEQAIRDKQRDRDFLSIGIPTIRFNGSEVYNHADECLEDIYTIVHGNLKCAIV